MTTQQASPIPEIFILWHPNCPIGGELARRIHLWLRPGRGLGPQVYYRSLPAPEAPEKGLPPPLPGETRGASVAYSGGKSKVSDLQIVLPLIDEQMVADPTWRYWVETIGAITSSSPKRVIMPVALDSTAYNLPSPIRELNFLRPAGLPLPAGQNASGPTFEGAVRSLLRQVTEAMSELMLSRQGGNDPAQNQNVATRGKQPKLTIFLSHAKVDGTSPARRLRDYIYSQTQLAAFYDENDISYGALYRRILESSLDGAVALVAIRSEQYANRPWCRRELSVFREPRPEKQSPAGFQRWRLFPTLVVDAMDGGQRSAGIPEFGNSSVIRWTDNFQNLEESIVTTVLRDAMLATFHSALGASIPAAPNAVVLNWQPDPTTLLHIPSVRSGGECDIVYPGRMLSGLELDILTDFFPNLNFLSFEEMLS